MFKTDRTPVGPGDRFADRLGINGIAFVPLHIGLYADRWYQANRVAQRLPRATNDATRLMRGV